MVLVSNEMSGKIKESIESLEEQELREQDETGENVYKKLLILYILDEQEMKAKFLWKRIPVAFKSDSNNELNSIWSLIRQLIQRNYAQFFDLSNLYKSTNKICNSDSELNFARNASTYPNLIGEKVWSSPEIGQLLEHLLETSRERLFDLISEAYTSISIQHIATMLGMPADQVEKIALMRQWSLDESTRTFLLPKKKPTNEAYDIPNQLQMQQLTNLVSFIEN